MIDPDLASDGYGDDEPAGIGDNRPPATFEDELRLEHQDVFLRVEAMKIARAKLPAVVNSDADLKAVGVFVVAARGLVKAIEAAHQAASAPFKAKASACDVLFLTRGLKGEVEAAKKVVEALGNDYTARKEAERRRELQAQADQRREEEEARAYEAAALKDAGAHSAAEVVESQSEHSGKTADRLEAKAEGKVADVVRTQMDGVTASGRSKWVGEVEDWSKVDFNAMRDAIYAHEAQQIVDRFVNGGGREAAGVNIYAKTIATFR